MIYVFVTLLVAIICCLTYAVIKNKNEIEAIMLRNIDGCKNNAGTQHNIRDMQKQIDQLELKPYVEKIKALGEIDCDTSGREAFVLNGKPHASIFYDNVYVTGIGVLYGVTEKRACIKMDVEDFLRFAETLEAGETKNEG